MITSGTLRWAEHAASMEKKGNAYVLVGGNLKGRGDFGDLCLYQRMILK